MHCGQAVGWPRLRKTREARLMLTDDSPVVVSIVPLPSLANVLTTQVEGKPLTGTGGPKKQVASKAQAPRKPAQSASVVHDCDGVLTQCWVGCGPGGQSAPLVPRLAIRFTLSVVSKIDEEFSGISDGGSLDAPAPMYRQPRPRVWIGVVRPVSENRLPEKGPVPPLASVVQSEPTTVVKERFVP